MDNGWASGVQVDEATDKLLCVLPSRLASCHGGLQCKNAKAKENTGLEFCPQHLFTDGAVRAELPGRRAPAELNQMLSKAGREYAARLPPLQYSRKRCSFSGPCFV